VVSSNPNAGQPEPLERDCLTVAGFGVGFAWSSLGESGDMMVSATPRVVGNLAIDREVGKPVLLDLSRVVVGRIVSGMIRLFLFAEGLACCRSRCANIAGTGRVGEGMILGKDWDAADGANY
jgi:hypothetical protein